MDVLAEGSINIIDGTVFAAGFAEGSIKIIDGTVFAAGFVDTEEDLFEAGVIYDLQFN